MKFLIAHHFQLIHKSLDVLNEDIITGNEDFFLLLRATGIWRQLRLFRSLIFDGLHIFLVHERAFVRLATLDFV